MQLGFSSNVASDMVALTNFVKNFNFCGGLYFDSLLAKPLSDLYNNSSSNFQQSNDWQKVQFNTDLVSILQQSLIQKGFKYFFSPQNLFFFNLNAV